MTRSVPHCLTIDFECWPQLAHRRARGVLRPVGGDGLARQTDRLLGLLADEEVTATVFVLGMAARRWPHLVKRIAEAGHEIACHGESHLPVHGQTIQTFRADLRSSVALISDITGQRPVGYRAPEFSIREDCLWALDVLAEEGFEYDSSIFPIRSPRYGIPSWPRGAQLVSGGRLVELPPATLPLGGINMPVAGGGWWRLLPQRAVLSALQTMADRGESAVIYVHPFEMDPEPMAYNGRGLPLWRQWDSARFHVIQNSGRVSVFDKLRAALPRHEWVTARELCTWH